METERFIVLLTAGEQARMMDVLYRRAQRLNSEDEAERKQTFIDLWNKVRAAPKVRIED